MYDDQSHPLLAQVPLTVSPFVSLPTATTLPYTYKQLPPSLPPSSVFTPEAHNDSDASRPRYVISASGHAAHPSDIIASCQSLQKHLEDRRKNASEAVAKWEQDIRTHELAEKRRVAPGWLDRNEKILEPAKAASQSPAPAMPLSPQAQSNNATSSSTADDEAGQELDRMFGAMKT